MELFETIKAHHDAMRLPLYAVTVTAAARVDTPVLLMLHWHGFRRETPVHVPGVPMPPRPVPGSALQIDAHWDSMATVDQAMLDAAWRFGAWDVERVTHRPWRRLGAPAAEALACRRAFGDYPDAEDGIETLVADLPDRPALMEMAARRGYVRWMFRPRKAGVWSQLGDEDSTVDEGGGRPPPCPVRPRPWMEARDQRFVYRLGRVDRLILPDTH
ncbi:diguanylate cyclase [Bordetella bronchialis]|uniref:Diguanylate cyclase n=1 Tax=Bordetella bronchialis TaxID=463025 RepID=A0A193FN49_9BORD|nr:diguanylate cyclase [Bordetella bronchialis]ANN68683.1 diguanylate cyclase [Bordetella bronchialis]ANN73823.1 diguanylate cyclase [Bordetella bronchialis]